MSGGGFQFSLGGVSKRSATKPKLAFGLGAAKPKLPIAFAQDSDSDGEETAGKKQRTGCPACCSPAAAGVVCGLIGRRGCSWSG